MSEEEYWECCKRKCKWIGTDDEKSLRDNNDGFSQTHICPECGNDEFYEVKGKKLEKYIKNKEKLGERFVLKPCPFCGEIPNFPHGDGTQYEIECDCGMSRSCIQIPDLMETNEKAADEFTDYRYDEIYVERAKKEAIKNWNKRV